MKISIEIESIDELERLLGWRDALRDRIAELEREPLQFSLPRLAKDVVGNSVSLTPDQRNQISELIENQGRKPVNGES